MSSGYAAALALCLWVRPMVGQSGNDTTLRRKIDPSRLALPAPSTELIAGYPAVTVDKRVIQQMLRAQGFAELDRMFEEIQARVKGRIQLEFEWVVAARAFGTADSTLGSFLDAWVASIPTSAHARVARATYNRARAWDRRGTNYINETARVAVRQMTSFAAAAANDAVAALQLDSTNLIAYGELLGVLQFGGDQEKAREVFEAGRKHYRGSYYLADMLMDLLTPRWGGSFDEMDALATQVAADSALNPRLAHLLGASEAERSSLAESNGDYSSSLTHISAALRYGPEIYYYLQRGDALANQGDYDRAIVDLNTVLSYLPLHPRALELHGYAAMSSADWEIGEARIAALNQARSDYELLLSVDPLQKFPRENLPSVKTSLRLCPRDWHLCPQAREEGTPTRAEIKQMRAQFYKVLGIALLLGSWGFYRWIRSGFWIPRYIHLLAAFALFTVCAIDLLWVRAGAKMTAGRWITIPIFPLIIYFLFIGLGGAVFSPRPTAEPRRNPASPPSTGR